MSIWFDVRVLDYGDACPGHFFEMTMLWDGNPVRIVQDGRGYQSEERAREAARKIAKIFNASITFEEPNGNNNSQ